MGLMLPWKPPSSVRPRDARDQYQRALGAPIPKATAADAKPKRRRVLRGSRPNAGIEQEYRERLERMVAEMAASVLFWTKAIYRKNEPATVRLAMDESEVMPPDQRSNAQISSDIRPLLSKAAGAEISGMPGKLREFWDGSQPSYRDIRIGITGDKALAMDRKTAAEAITEAFAKIAKRWQKRFDEAAPKLARWFAQKASRRSDATLQRILRDGGFSVKFTMTPAAADIIDAAVAENVALIKSIPSQYLTQVEGAVMRSVRQGRDLGPLAKELRAQYGVTKRRAALIARDQNAKATADMTRARQVEKGYKAIWRHSHAGKTPRPSHVANDGKTYDPARGWWDPHEKKLIWPGTLINCFPASTEIQFAHRVEKAFRHRYCGQLAEFITDTGKALTATPNHPVLTLNGWCPIGALQEGDYVFEFGEHRGDFRIVESNINDTEALICEIFDAITDSGRMESHVAICGDFHGDAVPNTNIDVVFADRFLTFGGQAGRKQCAEQFLFPMADQATLCLRASQKFGMLSLHSPNRIMSGSAQARALLDAGLAHADVHRIAAPANATTGAFDPFLDNGSGDTVVASERQQTCASLMLVAKAARIVSTGMRQFSGHVYNLQTDVGWYVAGGIIAHNCRCFSQTLVPGFEP
jgi:hypothetical protein